MRSVKAMRGCLVAAEIGKLVARSGFGSPAIFVGVDDIYFGNDRLPLVREAVLRKN